MTMDFINSLIDASIRGTLLGITIFFKEIPSLDVPEMQMVPAEAGRKRYRVIKGGGT